MNCFCSTMKQVSFVKSLVQTQSLGHVWLFVTPWTVASQTPLPMGILQARMLEWVAMFSFKGSSQPRDRTQVSHIMGRFFTIWATREAPRGFQAISNRVLSSIAILGGFPGGASGKKPACQCRLEVKDVDSIPGSVRKIPWRRTQQPTPIFLPGESCRQRRLASCSPRVTEADMTEAT